MKESELNFRKEKLREVSTAIEFYEEQIERLKEDLSTERTIKNDKRYVNYMAVLTNLENNVINYKSQKFGMEQEIKEEKERRKQEKELKKEDE